MKYLLGIDIGTSGTKTVLFNENLKTIASKTVEYPVYTPENGWAEQKPSDWWNATLVGIKDCLTRSGITKEDVKGIGLSGQMHGLVMLDKGGNVLRDSIIWCDQRTEAECEDLERIIGKDNLIAITGNPAMTGFTAAKILWVKKNEPELYNKCAHILLPKDYIRYELTGIFATEVSDASGMQLMDITKRDWSDELLDKLDIDKNLLGKMYESQDVTGVVQPKIAQELGLSADVIVVGGAGDNPAAAIGTGVYTEGKAFTTIGTSAVIYAVSDTIQIDPKGRVHTLCASVPNKWTFMSCTQAAGLSLQWMRNQFCQEEVQAAKEQNVDPYTIMTAMAQTVEIGSNKLIYLPYLMGERSPHPDPNCRGVFFGLSNIHEKKHLIRSVIEGVAFSQLECFEVFKEMGISVDTMLLCGGGAKSPLWRQMLADLYQCEVETLVADEGPALGVAILAGVGAKIYPSIASACDQYIKTKDSLKPDINAHNTYMPYYELYKNIYRSLTKDFETLSKI